MKKIFSVSLICLLLSTILFSCYSVSGEENDLEIVNADSYGNGYRYNVQGWIYVHIEGEPYERGYQHGYLLSAEIVDIIQRWSNTIHVLPVFKALVNDFNSSRYTELSQKWWEFCKSRIVRIYWDNYPYEYQQEIKGIADGVSKANGKVFGEEITYEDILTLNEFYEFMVKFENKKKGIHPLKTFWESIRNLFPDLSEEDGDDLVSSFLSEPKTHHCDGFIATGDATTNGQIVISHATRGSGDRASWFSNYISGRWNVILDIKPSNGYRVIMSTAPGYIWSDENYYQNSNGIVLIDTQYMQGYWHNSGLSFAIRTRKAAQYSDSIDQAIYHIRHDNDGIWPAIWLIGDTKTGEISRVDVGYNTYEVWRTYDGFYWSANNVMSTKVSREVIGFNMKGFLLRILHGLFKMETYYEYYTRKYFPSPDDLKFEELGEKYYGDIDADVVKKIMATYPIADEQTIDCKITDSFLVEDNGLWAYFGNLYGDYLYTSNLKPHFKDVKDVPPAGWVLLYGLPEGHDFTLIDDKKIDEEGEAEVIWKYKVEGATNADCLDIEIVDNVVYVYTNTSKTYGLSRKNGAELWIKDIDKGSDLQSANDTENGDIDWDIEKFGPVTSSPRISDGVVYVGSWDTNLYALDQETGDILWKYKTGWGIDNTPAVDDDMVFFGSMDNSFYALDKETGEVEWVFNCIAAIHSSPVVYGEYVFFGCDDGRFYALNKTTGESAWIFTPGYSLKDDVYNYVTTPILSDPIIDDGKVLFSAKGTVYVLDTQTTETIKKAETEDLEISEEAWLFIIVALLLVIFVTAIYLIISKRNNK